jgi:hypothetical protein
MSIKDFFQGTTKNFNLTIIKNGVYPDITDDEVVFYLDFVSGSLTSSADVASSGSGGTAIFEMPPEATEGIEPGVYNYEIYWQSGSAFEYILDSSEVQILNRISQ